MMMKYVPLLYVTLFLCSEPVIAEDWLGFRGSQGTGISTGQKFPITWNRTQNIRWRTPLPAPGNGSPIVVGNRIYLVYAENEGHQRSTVCFDRNSGEELWKQTVAYPRSEETHKTNPFGPSTPASDGKRIYSWHRSAGMHCYDLDGRPIWSRDLGEFRHIWGGGSSPILYKDLVIQLCGPGKRTFLVALDKNTGEIRWQSNIEPGGSASDQGRYVGSWATPVIVNVEGQDRLITPYHIRTVSYNPSTGKEIAFRTGLEREKSDLCYTSPVVGNGQAVIMGGFKGPAFAFTLGGIEDTTDSHRLWRNDGPTNPQRIGSGVIIDEYLYMANADGSGSIECLHVESGEQGWMQRRTEDGPHWGSIIFADGNLFATGQKGTTSVFKPNPQKFELVSVNSLEETTNSTPAFSDGELFIRTHEALYCIAED